MTEREPARGSIRTCVGCHEEAAPAGLVRFVLTPEGGLVPDLGGGSHGRGAWVHARAKCISEACRKGFMKSFKSAVEADPAVLSELIARAAERRIFALLASALGSRRLVVGAAEVKEALGRRQARLVIVATDARAAAESHEVRAAIASGLARAWATKSELGRATHRTETGIVAVLDPGLGRALAQTIDWAHTAEPTIAAGGDPPTEE
ncbi:MAG: DUF448 domain-containing protein [Myxococcales bacterium]|nr:DUF448 domain-containing protein [Myxococcales bacterium]